MRLGVGTLAIVLVALFCFQTGFESGDFTQCDAFNVGQV
jgi:predicted metalloprotease